MFDYDLNCRTESGMPTKLAHMHECTVCGVGKLCEDFLLNRSNSPICGECAAIEDAAIISAHRYELVTTGPYRHPSYQGKCSCGESSEKFPTAGMAASWHGSHVDEMVVR